MARLFFFLLLTLSLAFPLESFAKDPVVIGKSCDQLGASLMTTDQKNIAVCLKDDAKGLIWKSSTSSSSESCGFAVIGTNFSQNGSNVYAWPAVSNVIPCEKQDVIKTSAPHGWGGNCPSGYTLKVVSGIYTGAFYSVYDGGSDTHGTAPITIGMAYCQPN